MNSWKFKNQRQGHPRTEKRAEGKPCLSIRPARKQKSQRPDPAEKNRDEKGTPYCPRSQKEAAARHQLDIPAAKCAGPDQTDQKKGQAYRENSCQPDIQNGLGEKRNAQKAEKKRGERTPVGQPSCPLVNPSCGIKKQEKSRRKRRFRQISGPNPPKCRKRSQGRHEQGKIRNFCPQDRIPPSAS